MEFRKEKESEKYDNLYYAKNILAETLKTEFGLELFTMEENKNLGQIIDVMKSNIIKSKFLICDLSHKNNGAYFEGGFAEGLGKKVIYICDEGGDKKEAVNNIHFDKAQDMVIFYGSLGKGEAKNREDFISKISSVITANFLD